MLKEIIQTQIKTWIKENYETANICRFGDDWCYLSEEESYAFAIHLTDWPRLLACWLAYDAVIGACDHGLEKSQWLKFQEYRLSQDWIEECSMSLENFQRFGQEFGFTYRETTAIYWKQEFHAVRSGETRYKDENMEETE